MGRPMKEYNKIHRALATLEYVDTQPQACNCEQREGEHDAKVCLFMDFLNSYYEYHPNSTPGGPHYCDSECKNV